MNPFLHFRERLGSYRRATEAGLGDDWFVERVESLDAAVAKVDGRGFRVTPLRRFGDLVPDGAVWAKDETGNVGGSHKARHLFGLALHLAVDEAGEGDPTRPLAIASCGNAALGAAIVSRAMHRRLRVFIPTWADDAIVARLADLGADVVRCERRVGETGDPAYLRFREEVARGAVPFSVQSPDAPRTLDGGRTLGWELGEQLNEAEAHPARLFVQVGGGALAASCAGGIRDIVDKPPALHPVQASAAAPLARAWHRLLDDGPAETAIARARTNPQRYMEPWSPIGDTVATGILDDVTYDWLGVLEAMIGTGGSPVVVTERQIVDAHERARAVVDVSPTGSAGLAGLLALPGEPGEESVVLFTGIN